MGGEFGSHTHMIHLQHLQINIYIFMYIYIIWFKCWKIISHPKWWSHHRTNLIMRRLKWWSKGPRLKGDDLKNSLPPGVWCQSNTKTSGKHQENMAKLAQYCQVLSVFFWANYRFLLVGWNSYKIDRHIAKKRVGSAVVLDRCAQEEETSIFSKCSNIFNTYGPSRKLFSNQLEQKKSFNLQTV